MRQVIKHNQHKPTEKKIIEIESNSFKDGIFTKEELKQYKSSDKDINTILSYQQELPILQQDNNDWINARLLHLQLGVNSKFSDWIKFRIEKYDFVKNEDFSISEKKEMLKRGSTTLIEYTISLDMAKQLCMVENNEFGKLTRKYFIAIEKAFKNRIKWNSKKKNTLIKNKELIHALLSYRKELIEAIPEWANSLYMAEYSMFNRIIIGMNSITYKKINNISKGKSIRENFTEEELSYIDRLELYDAQLIFNQQIFNYKQREELLTKEYLMVKSKKTKYV